ncbi:glycosyltransferase involved in cell wall biosynthesis [Methanofollis sp. W23]|uniref:glycosyltransferase family 4 protein n=1 Tax=Methanofollis sp. W23 TaxID=2817849 RepID=UPI001AE6FE35|nr:glycosyltransferase family 4 protein [Methanofollis sp. W23]MBP2144594.1 glycosyltransferase involved in cell wall biosynthesis [Methanofollis sp. W23]
MKICLIGALSGDPDEGYRNVTGRLSHHLAPSHEVLPLDGQDVHTPGFWHRLRGFDPEVVHCISAPTVRSFILLRAARSLCQGHPSCVLSALHPHGLSLLGSPWFQRLGPPLAPDLVLTQSRQAGDLLARARMRTAYLPHGVDLTKFAPVSPAQKAALRAQYGLPEDRFVLLHVGHLKPDRGLAVLKQVQAEVPACQVVVAGGSRFRADPGAVERLRQAGCIVWHRYFARIEELYQMADGYIFPPGTTLFLPLTILEAMACDLPVITHGFDGVSLFLEKHEGVTIVEDGQGYAGAVRGLMERQEEHVGTRQMVLPYDWDLVAGEVSALYTGLREEMQ